MRRYAAFILCSFILAGIISCSIPFPYTRQGIPEAIQSICKKEYDIDVTAWSAGDSIWVFYTPRKNILSPRYPEIPYIVKPEKKEAEPPLEYQIHDIDVTYKASALNLRLDVEIKKKEPEPPLPETGSIGEDAKEIFRHISNAVNRAILNTEKPPSFYCLALGIPQYNKVFYTAVFVPDMIKLQWNRISLTEYESRVLNLGFSDPDIAEGDKGASIHPYDISPNEFSSLLVFQELRKRLKDTDKKHLPPPIEKAGQTTRSILDIYLPFHSMKKAVIEDDFYRTLRELEFNAEGDPSVLGRLDEANGNNTRSLTKMYKIGFYYEMAGLYYEKKDYNKAKEYISKMLAIIPDYPYAFILQGAAENAQGNHKNALDYFEKVLTKYPDNTQAHEGSGIAYGMLKDYDKALKHFKKLIELKPEDWRGYYYAGSAYASFNEHKKAIEFYQQALTVLIAAVDKALKEGEPIDKESVDKRRAEINKAIGDSYVALGEHSLAEQYYQNALALDKNNAAVHVNLGIASQAKGDYKQAVEHYEKALKIDSESLYANWYLGRCYVELGQFVKALESFNTALKYSVSESVSSAIYVDIGLCYAQQGLHKDSVKFFETALKVDPKNATAHSASGYAYLNLKDFDKAIASFQTAIKQNDKLADSYRGLGLCYFYAKKYGQARPYFVKAKELFQAESNSKAVLEVQSFIDKIPE